jgi:hypothetical protein
MKRFASIDFLRGLAIFMMLFLHNLSDDLNINGLLANINNEPLINLVALVIFPFLGGLAGLFLLVSAVANMVSMNHHLQAGRSVGELVLRQVFGGAVLLVFAVLTESTFGVYGAFGGMFRELPGPGSSLTPHFGWVLFLSNGYTFETIHTIAWCIILNGIVQGILSLNGRFKNPRFMIKAYIVLGIAVVVATQFVWDGVAKLVPGYPFAIVNYGNGIEIQISKPLLGSSPIGFVFEDFFLIALAAPVEPIFPYLAISFVGSIIGIVISMPKESIPRHFTRNSLYIGMAMFIIGIIGVINAVIYVINTQGFDTAALMYSNISNHRGWVPNDPQFSPPYLSWLFQFMAVNGISIMMVILMIRIVEFRGMGKQFAKKSLPIRRFGFIAFMNYAMQFISSIPFYFLSILFTGVAYQRLGWGGVFVQIAAMYALYYGIMLLWERVSYTGTFEWCIGTISYNLIPGKKGTKYADRKWWQKGQLDVQGALINAEWLNIVEEHDVDHEHLVDSKLAFKFAIIGLISVIFIPTVFVTLRIALTAEKTEGKNKYNQCAKIVSIIGICLMLGVLITLFFITPAMIGISI